MKQLILSFLISAAATAGIAQKTINDPNAEKRIVTGFHGIDVGTGITLILTEGNAEEVAVSASTIELRNKIVTEVDGGILKIHYETKMGSTNRRNETKGLKAYVSYKALDHLYANTGADVQINGVLKSSSLDLKVNTGARVNGEVDINDLKVSQNTGSKLTLTGKAGKLIIDGDTGSKFSGEELSATSCSVSVSTGANVRIWAEKELQVKANTGGNVKYKGNATILEVKTSTGGSVSKI